MNLFVIAARNALRSKMRAVLTVGAGVVAIVTFVLLRTLVASFWLSVDYNARDRINTRNKVSFVVPLPKRHIEVIRSIPGIRVASWATWFAGKDPNNPQNFFASFGVDERTWFDVYDEYIIPPDQKKAWLEDKRGAIVGDTLAQNLKVKVGDKVKLEGTTYPGDWEFTVSGIYKPGNKGVDRNQFYFHWDYLNDTLTGRRKDHVNFVISRIDDPQRSGEICSAIDGRLEETTTMSERQAALALLGTLSAMLTTLDIVSLIVLLAMMLILGNTIAMGVRERTRDYAVLRAIGFSSGQIRSLIIAEGATLGLLTAALGIAAAYPLISVALGGFLEENFGSYFRYFRVGPGTVVASIAAAVGLGVAASLVPAFRAAKLSVVDALRRVA